VELQFNTLAGIALLVCVVGLGLAFILPLASAILTVLGGLLDFVMDLLTGGPMTWCGCLLVLVAIGGCCGLAALISYVLSTCGTPQAVRFCVWFGL